MSTEQASRFLSIAELARQSGLSISTIDRRVKDGSIPFIQPGGPRTRKFFRADVLERLASHVPTSSGSAAPASSTANDSAYHQDAPAKIAGPRPKWLNGQLNIKSR